jgi:large subunit ribosomal protein L18e
MLARFLRKAAKTYDAPIWSYVAELLERPARSRVEVNLSKLNRLAADGDVVLVPGKLLGAGRLDKKVVVAAAYASRAAVEAVLRAGGEVVAIPELVKRNPKGGNVKVVI